MKKKKWILAAVAAAVILGLLGRWVWTHRGGEERCLLGLSGTGGQVTMTFSPGEEPPVYHAAELLGDQRLGYIGAGREDLSFLGKSVVKVWMENVEVGEDFFAALGEGKEAHISAGTVPVYTLANGMKALVTKPAAEDVLIVYLGQDKVWPKVEMAWDGDADALLLRFSDAA